MCVCMYVCMHVKYVGAVCIDVHVYVCMYVCILTVCQSIFGIDLFDKHIYKFFWYVLVCMHCVAVYM